MKAFCRTIPPGTSTFILTSAAQTASYPTIEATRNLRTPLYRRSATVYTFAVNSSDKRWFKYYQDSKIRINSDRHYDGGDWLATPPPYLYLLSDAKHSAYISMGLVAQPGENSFLEYAYLGGEGFGLSLDYDGYTHCEGVWSSPANPVFAIYAG